MKIIFKIVIQQFNRLSGIAKRILISGQAVIFAIATSVFIYLLALLNENSNTLYTYEKMQSIKYMLECIVAGLSVLWGGALFIDYALKKKEEEKE